MPGPRENMLRNLNLQDINPRICGHQSCDPGHSYGPATREYYLLHFVRTGEGVLENTRGRHTAGPGDIFVIRPGERTTYTASEKTPWQYDWVGFESGLNLSEKLQGDVIHAPECQAAFALAGQPRLPGEAEFYVAARIFDILALLRRPTAKGPDDYILAAQNYLESNYQKEIRLSTLARNLGLNRSYFTKRFRQATGKPPQQYLLDLRMSRAAALMREHGLAPGEAAAEVGYPDIFSFSRMFKRHFGLSPSQYCQEADDSPTATE